MVRPKVLHRVPREVWCQWGNREFKGNEPDVPLATRKFDSRNVGSMMGRSGEVVQVLVRQRVDVWQIQQTQWKDGDGQLSRKTGKQP